MAGIFKLLQAIAYKIYIHRRRHFVLTFIELLVPAMFCGLLYFLNTQLQVEGSFKTKVPASNPDVNDEDYFKTECASKYIIICYAPVNEFTEKIMGKVEKAFEVTVKGFDSKSAVSNELGTYKDGTNRFGVVFKTTKKDENNFRYTILTSFQILNAKSSKQPDENSTDQLSRKLIESCFIFLQITLDSAFIEIVSAQQLTYKVYTQEFPYPETYVINDSLIKSLNVSLVLVIIVTIISVIIGIVEEKKSGSKELMKINGLTSSLVWFGWVLYANFAIIFDSVLTTVVLKYKPEKFEPIIPRIDSLLLFLIIFLYFNSVIFFAFFCSTLFTNALVATGVGLLFHLTTDIIGVLTGDLFNSAVYFGCLFPNYALKLATSIISDAEKVNVELNWNKIFRNFIDTPPISLAFILIMFVVDMIIYGILTYYIDALLPGPYGAAKKWNFCCPSFRKKEEIKSLSSSSTFFQETNVDLEVGLAVRNVSKVYPEVVAVKKVNLDIYEGEITVLLGHNGAGKTTLMSMITGMCSPTEGEIYRYKGDNDYYNIFDNMKKFRQNLGLCPQENLHFTYFTVIEHLTFFGIMKGLSVGEARRNGDVILELMGMKGKRKSFVRKLSGGMMRKLSLAIALVGVPEVLILDEPTSGMDPESRREIWDVLLGVRENRIVIITTHYMEEADILGDRIAIMEHGSIFCHGTSMFLKKIFGAGYYLQLMVRKGTDVNSLTSVITSIIPGANLIQSSDQHLTYILPLEWKSKFPKLFSELEYLNGIQSIGVSFTTLEEVFLKVDQIAAIKKKRKEEERDDVSTKPKGITQHDMEEVQMARELSEEYQWASMIGKLGGRHSDTTSLESNSQIMKRGFPLIMVHFCALLRKKIIYTYRTIVSTLVLGMLAMLMALFAILSMDLVTKDTTEEITMSSNMYEDSSILVHFTQAASKYSKIYKSLVHGSSIETIDEKSITKALMDVGKKDLMKYRLKYLLAADWRDDSAIALYSKLLYNGPVISVNLMTNTILKSYQNDKSITISAAQVITSDRCNNYQTTFYMGLVLWLMLIPIGLLFAVSNCIPYPFDERISGAKHLQLMTGLSPIIYWGTAYIVDVTVYTLFMLLMTVPIFVVEAMRKVYIFSNLLEIGTFFVIVELFGICYIPFAYLFSFFNRTFGKASTNIFILHAIVEILGITILAFKWVIQRDEELWNVFFYLFQLLPTYPLIIAITSYCMIIFFSGFCTFCKSKFYYEAWNCKDRKKEFFVFEGPNKWGINNYLIALVIDGIIYSILVLLIDYGLVGYIYHSIHKIWLGKPNDDENPDDDDNDVLQEQSKVSDALEHSDVAISYSLIVDSLVKKYTRKYTAVNDVSFVLTKGECFGLLGVNGAGKTTTFNILTGKVRPLSGNAHINENSLRNNKKKYLQNIGYCPQGNAFNKVLTGRQMIELFGQLRGLRKESINEVTDFWIKVLGLTEYQNRQCKTYSGGNKRKVSVAIALIGRPEVIFLDEPTSGVDPVSKRKLWTVLQYCQKFGQSIVLTSHSMDECEILCNKITIMVQGQMKCIGLVQYLKNKFSQGFTIIIKLALLEDYDNEVQTIKNKMEEQFRGYCILKDEHKGQLNYHITNVQEKWSNLFRKMENMKKEFEILEDYTISETTLEQLFLSFARE